MDYKISVIMPIYNAENHLKNTINSIINQSIGFENIELILVDDASKDNSKKIIESYAEKYDNIVTYYSEKNHGFPGFGRNIGLEKSTSDYLMFIDNDDEYGKDMCRTLYETIISENADVVACGRMMVDETGMTEEKIPIVKGRHENDRVILENDELFYFNSHIVLNKIFKKEIITSNNLKFNENSRLDDDMFSYDYYIYSEKLIYLKDYYGYYWNVNSDSLSHTNAERYIPEFMECVLYEYNQLKKQNKEQHITYRAGNAIKGIIYYSTFLELNNDDFKEVLKKIHNFEKEIGFDERLNEKWAETINKCILNEQYMAASILLKCIKLVRKSKNLQKINRKNK